MLAYEKADLYVSERYGPGTWSGFKPPENLAKANDDYEYALACMFALNRRRLWLRSVRTLLHVWPTRPTPVHPELPTYGRKWSGGISRLPTENWHNLNLGGRLMPPGRSKFLCGEQWTIH